MNRKTTKIIEIKARATSGNLRTVQAIAPLDFTLEDCCKLNNIPMLSIISVKESKPLMFEEATDYVIANQIAIAMDPSTTIVKSSIKMMVA